MALNSMTGFARTDGAAAGQRWTWELRSVNGKGLDLRRPPGLERLEIPVRERAGKRLSRGNCAFTLSVHREGAATTLRINEDALAAVVQALKLIAARIDAAPPTLDGILAIKGVVETAEADDDEAVRAAFDAGVLAGFEAALDGLVAAREREGAAIGDVLGQHLAEIERLARLAEACPARRPEAIRERLAEQVRTLMDAAPGLESQRLYQEAVLIATRADIREELDRLFAHVGQGRQLLADGGTIGRRFDFLAQEFNREANTLCTKANDRELTAIGLDLKTVVDQLREQIQNIE